jgi:hypothetical protein
LLLAVFAIPAGAIADRVNRKRLMIGCDAIRLIGAASIAGPPLGGSSFAAAPSIRACRCSSATRC